MMKAPLFAVLLGILAPLSASAWVEKGNGGNVIDCAGDPASQPAMTFFDVYEAQYRYDLDPVFPSSEIKDCAPDPSDGFGSPACLNLAIDLADKMLDRISAAGDMKAYADPYRRDFKEHLRSFTSEAKFLDGIELLPVEDTGLGFIPKGCSLKQLVLQHDPTFSEDKRYFVSRDYWKWMNPENQAAAILHEIFYRALIDRSYMGSESEPVLPLPTSSEKIRHFNALVLSGKVQNLPDLGTILRLTFQPQTK